MAEPLKKCQYSQHPGLPPRTLRESRVRPRFAADRLRGCMLRLRVDSDFAAGTASPEPGYNLSKSSITFSMPLTTSAKRSYSSLSGVSLEE
jgi:hypothetical protein